MKILILAQHFFPDSVGGSARVAFEQARELARLGVDVWAIVPKRKPSAKDTQIIDDVKIHRYGDGNRHIFGQSYVDTTQSLSVIETIMEREKPDAVLIHQPTIGHIFVKHFPKIPTFYMFHASVAKEVKFQGITGRGGWKRLFSWAFIKWMEDIESDTLGKSDCVFVLSEYSKRLACRLYPIIRNRITQIPTGVDTKRFTPPKNKMEVRPLIGIPEDKIVFVTVRRLVPRMGLSNLIRAVKLIEDKCEKMSVYIVGEGPMYKTLEKLINRFNLGSTVFLTGRVKEDDLQTFYQSADCFVLSTRAYEGLGISTLEALSCGLPVLGTPIGATKEILSKVDTRLLFESSKPADIAKGMEWFLEKGKDDKTISKKAREMVEKEYSWENAGKVLKEIIEQKIK